MLDEGLSKKENFSFNRLRKALRMKFLELKIDGYWFFINIFIYSLILSRIY